jgi:hypothetical protein
MMLLRQVSLTAATLLFQREILRLAPLQLVDMLLVELAIVLPRRRADSVRTGGAQPIEMAERIRAGIGEVRSAAAA